MTQQPWPPPSPSAQPGWKPAPGPDPRSHWASGQRWEAPGATPGPQRAAGPWGPPTGAPVVPGQARRGIPYGSAAGAPPPQGGPWGGPLPYRASSGRVWAPGQGQYGPPRVAATRRRGASCLAVGLVLLLVPVALAILAVIGWAGTVSQTSTTAPTSSEPSLTEEPEPTAQPTSFGDSAGRVPIPETMAQAQEWTKRNSIYTQALGEVSCPGKPTRPGASGAELRAGVERAVKCLDKAWTPALKAAGRVNVSPEVNIYSSEITTPCGRIKSGNAYYCSTAQSIWVATDLLSVFPPSVRRTPWMLEEVVAHEYGHAVQGRSGIMVAAFLQVDPDEREDMDTPSAMLMSRRLETQADCFAGAGMSALGRSRGMTAQHWESVRRAVVATGDDELSGNPDVVDSHGHGATRLTWWNRGHSDRKLSRCNTFVASAESVR